MLAVDAAVKEEGGLNKYVRDKTAEIKRDIAALEEARKRAESAVNKIPSLESAERSLEKRQAESDRRMVGQASRLDNADRRLAESETEQAEFEESQTPRMMNIVPLLRGASEFSGMTVYILTDAKAGDSDFASQILAVLKGANWKVSELPSDGWLPPGVSVQYGAKGRSEAAAKAVCKALAEERVDVFLPISGSTPWPSAAISDSVVIRVGQKRSWFLVNRMLKRGGQSRIPDPNARRPKEVCGL